MVRISDIDLIKELEKDSSISYVELAKKFGVSEAAIRKRISSLKEKGIIEKFTVEVNYQKLGFEIFAIVGIDCKPEALLKLSENLKKADNVRKLFTTSGDHSILIEVIFESMEKFSSFIKELENKDGVIRVCPSIVVKRIK